MKKRFWLGIVTAGLAGVLLFCFWQFVQTVYVDAHRRAVCRDMDEIRLAVGQYAAANGVLPDSLIKLVPDFISMRIIDPPARYGVLRGSMLVPPDPYLLRRTSRSFEIHCAFHGRNFTRIVMNATGEVRLE
jgi:hypothetical protein